MTSCQNPYEIKRNGSDNLKNILISSFGAALCIFFIAYLNSLDQSNVWLIPAFGASLVLVMVVHDSPLAKPRNVFFGHVLSASAGVFIFYLIGESSISIALGVALAIMVTVSYTHLTLPTNREV